MVLAFVNGKHLLPYCLYLILFMMIDVGQMESCSFVSNTYQVYNEEIRINSPNYPQKYPANCDCLLTLFAFVDSEVLVTFDYFDLAPDDSLSVYYASSGIEFVPPDKTCVGQFCPQLRAFEITLRFRTSNVTDNGINGFSAVAQSVPLAVLVVLFFLAISVPSCVFVWRNKYHKRIMGRQHRHQQPTIPAVYYSSDSSNVILPPPPSYEVASSMHPVCSVEDEPPPAYETDQPGHNPLPHQATIDSVNSAPP